MSTAINVEGYDPNASLHDIGTAIMQYEPLRNAFVETLINKFALSIIFSKEFMDQTAFMDRGMLQLGETVEGIYVDIANVMGYDADKAAGRELSKYDGNVVTAYTAMNWQKLYPVSISEDNLRRAFNSWGELGSFIAALVQSLYNAMRYDHAVMKHYAIARGILNGGYKSVNVPNMGSADDAKANTATVQSAIMDMTLVNTDYNPARVHNSDRIEDIYILTDNANRAYVNVMVDANAFNIDKVSWLGHVITTWPFYKHDEERLAELIEDYEPFTNDELSKLSQVQFVAIARDGLEVYINHRDMRATPVNAGAYINYFLHDWLTVVQWPWAQRAVFTTGTPSVTAVTVTPSEITASAGDAVEFTAEVTGENIYDSSVTWSVAGAESANTKMVGNQLIIGKYETATTLTVTATSNENTSKSGAATVTLS